MKSNEIYIIFQPQDVDYSYWFNSLSEGINLCATELSYNIHPIDTNNEEVLKNLDGHPVLVVGNKKRLAHRHSEQAVRI